MQLTDEVHQNILVLSEEGNALADKGKYREAIGKFIAALDLLPEPFKQ